MWCHVRAQRVLLTNNLFPKGWAKNTTFWEKVEPKYNLFPKGWTKIQPFVTSEAGSSEAGSSEAGSSEAGWVKIQHI